MRRPDYDKMREMLAYHEADTIQASDMYEILLDGCQGYNGIKDNDEIMDLFLQIWQTSKIPKIKVEE